MKSLLNFRYDRQKTVNERIYPKKILEKMFEESLHMTNNFIPIVSTTQDIVNDIIIPYTKLIAYCNAFCFGDHGEVFVDIEIINPLYEGYLKKHPLGIYSIGQNDTIAENVKIIALFIDLNKSGLDYIVQPKIDIYI